MISPEALAFSSICSGRLAPTMAEATVGWRSTQASENCARRRVAEGDAGVRYLRFEDVVGSPVRPQSSRLSALRRRRAAAS